MPDKIVFKYIGRIRSEHVVPEKTPIQPVYAKGCLGRAEIFPEYEKGLQDIEGFSHVYIIYHLHKAKPTRLMVKPFLEDVERGLFATRAPCRPNPIGFSVVRLLKRKGWILHLADVDILDGTPILDIKPFIARYDNREKTRNGWQDHVDEKTAYVRGRRNFQVPVAR
jgi:tRNA-Thr(GGU) m(6)t(6)A37 methyltransferase TsaA